MVKHGKSSKGKSSRSNSKSRSRQRSVGRSGSRSRSRSRSPAKATRTSGMRTRQHNRPPSSGRDSRSPSPPRQKRALSSYNLFIQEQMSKRKFTKGQVVQEMKNLAQKWKTMSDDDKKKYKSMADDYNRNNTKK